MIIKTRTKVTLARFAANVIVALRRLAGLGPFTYVKRDGFDWDLNLMDGIDFSIYLLGSFEPKTQTACKKLVEPGDIAIDIGANRGAHTLALARAVGVEGRVIAFEPTLPAFSRLSIALELNPDFRDRVTLKQSMLTCLPSQPLPERIAATWPLTFDAECDPLHMSIEETTQNAIAETLDAALKDLKIQRVDFIKIDVDGFEMDVLSGGEETLKTHSPIIILEVSPYMLEKRGLDGLSPLKFLKNLDYLFFKLNGSPLTNPISLAKKIREGTSLNIIAMKPDTNNFS